MANRLASATVSANIAPVKTFTYDAIGNLLSKSDVGNYTYPLAGSALPHAVIGISGGAISTSFTYDPNGNQTAGLNRSITYTSYNKPSAITQGTKTLFFSHDTDHLAIIPAVASYYFPDGILSRPKPPRKRLVYHDHGFARGSITWTEVAAFA